MLTELKVYCLIEDGIESGFWLRTKLRSEICSLLHLVTKNKLHAYSFVCETV